MPAINLLQSAVTDLGNWVSSSWLNYAVQAYNALPLLPDIHIGSLVNSANTAIGNITRDISANLADMAPRVEVSTTNGSSTISDPSTSNTPPTSSLRLADGGYFDNSAVSSGMSYLAANNAFIADGYEDFDITSVVFGIKGATISDALAAIHPNYNELTGVAERLFTLGAQQDAVKIPGTDITLVDLSHPSSALFDATKTGGLDEAVWRYSPLDDTSTPEDESFGNLEIKFFRLSVETIDDNTLGIAGGLNGTLNLWVVNSDTDAIPLATGGYWKDYEVMYQGIIEGLQTLDNGQIGADLFARSLGYTVL